jgi:hypothetical protein
MRANVIGEGSDETPQPEEEERTKPNPFGKEDHSALNLSPNKFLIDENKNKKKRKVYKIHPGVP